MKFRPSLREMAVELLAGIVPSRFVLKPNARFPTQHFNKVERVSWGLPGNYDAHEVFKREGVVYDNVHRSNYRDKRRDFFAVDLVDVHMPDGWTIVETDNPVWQSIRDDKGRERGRIRNPDHGKEHPERGATWIISVPRFNIDVDENGHFATDCGVEIRGTRGDVNFTLTWLNECYPKWQLHYKYWDAEPSVPAPVPV